MPQEGINVLALLKNGERHVFLYDDSSADQLLQTLAQYAADPELDFSWYDAAVLSQRVRKLREESVDVDASPTGVEGPHNRLHGRAA